MESANQTILDALKISPQFDANDWARLDMVVAEDWPQAVRIVRDRLEGRFLKFANQLIRDPYSGFIVLAIDCLLAETLQQFREGLVDADKQSGRLIRAFLAGPRFQPLTIQLDVAFIETLGAACFIRPRRRRCGL